MLLLDLSHTAHSQARTGVQRVALELRNALRAGAEIAEITHDPYARQWRRLQPWEQAGLAAPSVPQAKRGSRWPLTAQLSGTARRLISTIRPTTGPDALPDAPEGVVFPEIFTARTGAQLPKLFAHVRGPRVAVFHDAIPLRLPEFTPNGTVGRFPAYLQELTLFDGIAAVSDDSRQSLLDYCRWAGWTQLPPVITLPLGCDHLADATTPTTPTHPEAVPRILSVGSLEGRKNHLSLLAAAEQLWGGDVAFELEIIGGLQRDTGTTTLQKIEALQAAGHPLIYRGWLTDDDLRTAYRRAAFTVYPSILEGFGLPIWESLRHGKPCICGNVGAIAETARGGGCLPTDTTSPSQLAQAMRQLLKDPELRQRLTRQAIERQPTRWVDYATQLQAWMCDLPRSLASR